MVYQLSSDDMNRLMNNTVMSTAHELSHNASTRTNSANPFPITSINTINPTPRSSSTLLESNSLEPCMQQLAGQYHDTLVNNSRLVLQDSNGQSSSSMSVMRGKTMSSPHDHSGAAATLVGSGGGSCTPRPRWCPTPEQIQVLEALFHSGTTTPSRDMIVEIAACLKQFGSIVEANVFYWFQNRKARAKRKLRLQAAQSKQQKSAAISSCSSLQAGAAALEEPYVQAPKNNAQTSSLTPRFYPHTADKSSPSHVEDIAETGGESIVELQAEAPPLHIIAQYSGDLLPRYCADHRAATAPCGMKIMPHVHRYPAADCNTPPHEKPPFAEMYTMSSNYSCGNIDTSGSHGGFIHPEMSTIDPGFSQHDPAILLYTSSNDGAGDIISQDSLFGYNPHNQGIISNVMQPRTVQPVIMQGAPSYTNSTNDALPSFYSVSGHKSDTSLPQQEGSFTASNYMGSSSLESSNKHHITSPSDYKLRDQAALNTLSPVRCHHLPLWEALAPYMSIGS